MVLAVGPLLSDVEGVCVKVEPVVDADFFATPDGADNTNNLITLKMKFLKKEITSLVEMTIILTLLQYSKTIKISL